MVPSMFWGLGKADEKEATTTNIILAFYFIDPFPGKGYHFSC